MDVVKVTKVNTNSSSASSAGASIADKQKMYHNLALYLGGLSVGVFSAASWSIIQYDLAMFETFVLSAFTFLLAAIARANHRKMQRRQQ